MTEAIFCFISLLALFSGTILLALAMLYVYLFMQNNKKISIATRQRLREQARREREEMEKYYMKQALRNCNSERGKAN